MITRTVRRATTTATCVTLLAVSCSVYDASLLESGSSPIASGGSSATSGHAGTAGTANAGANNGGSSGSASDDAGSSGMSEMAGEVESGGTAGGGTAGGGTAGTVGTAGMGGTGGSAVAGGGNSGGTFGGTGGSTAGNGGSGGAPPATGCAKLSVPLDDANDRAHFVITFPGTVDMTTGTVSMRVFVQAGVGGTIFNYVQDAAPNYHFFVVTTAARRELPSVMGWTNLTWDVGAQPDTATPVTNIVKASIKRVGIEINSAPATTWSNPTVVYIDSITVTTPTQTQSFTFDTAAALTTTGTTSDPSTPILWLNTSSSDTKAANVTLAWQATCP